MGVFFSCLFSPPSKGGCVRSRRSQLPRRRYLSTDTGGGYSVHELDALHIIVVLLVSFGTAEAVLDLFVVFIVM